MVNGWGMGLHMRDLKFEFKNKILQTRLERES